MHRFWVLLILSFIGFGCSQGFEVAPLASKAGGSLGDGIPETNPPPQPAPTPDSPLSDPVETSPSVLGICSPLDFVGVEWPMTLVFIERKAMALALSITGSFEGSGGWSTIGNNSDGQGLSLGLSQQNLGQGTLQPMFRQMIAQNRSTAKILFTDANFSSLTGMIDRWSKQSMTASDIGAADEFSKPVDVPTDDVLFPNTDVLSPLDIGAGESAEKITAMSTATNQSVTWAVANLYQSDGKTFKSDWKQSLKSLAATVPYRSLQIQQALTMFAKADGYFKSLEFSEMRSLLTLYDFVVQNGGFNSTHLAQYRAYQKSNPKASETARLLKLLAIRLASVRDQYKGDVDSRKKTIIHGAGTVHGAKRDLQKEYCFKSVEPVKF